jgi:hypothetical protein
MVNVNSIWEELIKQLNGISNAYTFIKSNILHDIPPYPYVTVMPLTPYRRDKDMLRGTITHENVTDPTKVKIVKTENPKMIFSFNCYSDNLPEVFDVLKATTEYLTFIGQQELSDNGIIVLECEQINDRTSFMEVDYKYCWGFDCTIRVSDIVTMNVDSIGSIEAIDQTSGEIIEM